MTTDQNRSSRSPFVTIHLIEIGKLGLDVPYVVQDTLSFGLGLGEIVGFRGEIVGFRGEIVGFRGEIVGFRGEIVGFRRILVCVFVLTVMIQE